MGEEALYRKQMCMTEKKQERPTMGCRAVRERLFKKMLASDFESAPLQAPSQKGHIKVVFLKNIILREWPADRGPLSLSRTFTTKPTFEGPPTQKM